METQKSFDAVWRMRAIRDALSREFRDMSYEEQARYIRERVRVHPSGDSAGTPADPQPVNAGDGGPVRPSE